MRASCSEPNCLGVNILSRKRNDLLIPEVFVPLTGEYLQADKVFAHDQDQIHTWRRELSRAKRQKTRLWVCSLCQESVFIAGGRGKDKRRPHFKHYRDIPACPYQTRDLDKEAIRRVKYNGAKESPLHRELKEFIYSALRNDVAATDVAMEKTLFIEDGGRHWRRPDVSATWNGIKVVFEVQISSDFLDVIVGREDDYRSAGVFIIWVFRDFDPERFVTKDIYVGNQKQVFVLTKRAMELSRSNESLVLECYYKVPEAYNGSLIENWHQSDVMLADMTFKQDKMQAFYHNYDEARGLLESSLLRSRFENYWCEVRPGLDPIERNEKDIEFQVELSAKLLGIPKKWDSSIEGFLNALYSLHRRTPIAYKMNLFGIVDNALNSRKQYSYVLFKAVELFGCGEMFKRRDAFKTKLKQYRDERNTNPKYLRNRDYDTLFMFLFPVLCTLK